MRTCFTLEVRRRPAGRGWDVSWWLAAVAVAPWWAAVAVGWACAGAGTARGHHHTTPHHLSSQSAAAGSEQSPPAHRVTLQARCHPSGQARARITAAASLKSLYPPNQELWLYLCQSAVDCTGHGAPHSNGRLGALSLSDPWVQMCLSNKHPPFQRGVVFLSIRGSREPITARTSSLVLEASWRHSYEGICSSGL